MESQPQEADFLWKVSLKILNSGLILKTFTIADISIGCTRKFCQGRPDNDVLFFLVIKVFHRGPYAPPWRRAVCNKFSKTSNKPIVTCDFLGGAGRPALHPSGSTHD